MARLSFFKGAVTGKLGEFVGSKWKGINYLRLYAKPSNPRTEGQISIRAVFKAVSLFASALFGNGFLAFVPPAKQMTERNSVFRANRQMFTNKTFIPEALQISKSNYPASVKGLECLMVTGGFNVSSLSFVPPDSVHNLQLHTFVYDTSKGSIVSSESVEKTPNQDGIFSFTDTIGANQFFDTPEASLPANCRCFSFITATSDNEKLLISSTVSCAVGQLG
jgi:hypothetical protein